MPSSSGSTHRSTVRRARSARSTSRRSRPEHLAAWRLNGRGFPAAVRIRVKFHSLRHSCASARASHGAHPSYTGVMQLRNARLCLDCEEVHESQQCPSCASESFVFITRWVPAPERRQKPRTGEPPPAPETVETYRDLLTPRQDNWRF